MPEINAKLHFSVQGKRHHYSENRTEKFLARPEGILFGGQCPT